VLGLLPLKLPVSATLAPLSRLTRLPLCAAVEFRLLSIGEDVGANGTTGDPREEESEGGGTEG
jgi:hypothetical protein